MIDTLITRMNHQSKYFIIDITGNLSKSAYLTFPQELGNETIFI